MNQDILTGRLAVVIYALLLYNKLYSIIRFCAVKKINYKHQNEIYTQHHNLIDNHSTQQQLPCTVWQLKWNIYCCLDEILASVIALGNCNVHTRLLCQLWLIVSIIIITSKYYDCVLLHYIIHCSTRFLCIYNCFIWPLPDGWYF